MQEYQRAADKKLFRRKHEGTLILYEAAAKTLKEQGFTASAPYNGEQWGIGAEGAVCIKEGNRVHIEHRLGESASRAATVFQRLVSAGKRLLRVIEHNEGGANKDLAKFADQINALCDKWDR